MAGTGTLIEPVAILRKTAARLLLMGAFALLAPSWALPVEPRSQATAVGDAAWPMYGHDAGHAGRTPIVGPQDGALAWTFETGNTGFGARSPVVGAEGTLYVADTGGLMALSPAGGLLWRYQPGGTLSVPAVGSDGTIYVGSAFGLVALQPDGSVAWTYPSGAAGGPVVAPDGAVYVVAEGPAVYALEPDGVLRWRQEVPGVYGMPAVGPAGDVYVTATRELCNVEFCVSFGRLFALDPRSGRPRRLFANLATGAFTSPPVVGRDGTIYVGTDPDLSGAALHAVRPSGGRKWQRKIGGFVESPPALAADGTVYVAAGDGFVYAIRASGRLAWRYETEGAGGPGQGSLGITSSPVVAGDGTVYLGSQDGFVYALNPDGTLKWRLRTAAAPGETSVIQTSPAIGADGALYISGWIGDPQPKRFLLYAIGPGPGLAPRRATK